MDLSRLAAKQKRAKDWESFLADPNSVQSRDTASAISGALKEYKAILASWWSKQSLSESDQNKIASLERELEELNERARMTVVPTQNSR